MELVRSLVVVVSLSSLAGCASAPVACPCPEPLTPAAIPAAGPARPALEPLLASIVQIKVHVGETIVDGARRDSFEVGTGFFVDRAGRILTAAHVLAGIEDPRSLSITYRGRVLQARILRVDRDRDLALLLVDAGQTVPLRLAAEVPALGEKVFALGYPFVDVFTDSVPAVSVGHLAGTDRSIDFAGQRVVGLLMTDAFVADGCSGGPLLSETGEVIGVLRFNLARKGNWLGLSFAQPLGDWAGLRGGQP